VFDLFEVSSKKDILPVFRMTLNPHEKIYRPFRQERISLKNDKFQRKLVVFPGNS